MKNNLRARIRKAHAVRAGDTPKIKRLVRRTRHLNTLLAQRETEVERNPDRTFESMRHTVGYVPPSLRDKPGATWDDYLCELRLMIKEEEFALNLLRKAQANARTNS